MCLLASQRAVGSHCVTVIFDELSGVDGKSIVVVVSPLIVIMKDHVLAMEARNVRAVYVGDCAEEGSEATDICSTSSSCFLKIILNVI